MIDQPQFQYLTVSEINEYVKGLLDRVPTLKNITIKGEITGWKPYGSTIYYTIKDAFARIKVVYFLSGNKPFDFQPKDGDEVLVSGTVTLYERDGSYQINAKSMVLFGAGDQLLRLKQLKEKLLKEGLFDESRKRRFPLYPKRIAILAGRDSAALKDLTFNLHRRAPQVQLIFFPSLVQGLSAPTDIIATLKAIYSYPELDVLIIARGGGAEDDLSAFNDEQVVRTVALSPMPTIAAIGHEINQTLVDFVADKRVSTPTAAAEFAVKDMADILTEMRLTQGHILQVVGDRYERLRDQLAFYKDRPVIKDPSSMYRHTLQTLVHTSEKLTMLIAAQWQEKSNTLKDLKGRLKALNPLEVLKRGFSLVTDRSGKIMTSIERVTSGQSLDVTMKDGIISASVTSVKPNKK